jgi:uroporphyrinogen decarboxylase
MEHKLLRALQGKNTGRPPIWLMRQAGRYLPEYRALRETHRLKELFFTPEWAAEVTLMPIRRFALDAAILFSDITVVAEALGINLDFNEGPVVTPKASPGMSFRPCMEKLDPIIETVRLLKPQLRVPLIGFCGAPFTVASYLIGDLEETKKWIADPRFSHLLDQIADVSCEYLKRQVAAGVDAVQIFDSWANVLSEEEWRRFALPYIKRLAASVPVPAIFFMRGAARYVDEIPCAVSLDWEADLAAIRLKTKKTLQGNLDPDILFGPLPALRERAQALLESMRDDPAFIVNLGHGVKPGTPIEAVHCLIESVHAGSSLNHSHK